MNLNSKLFFECLNHPEPLIDPYYCLEELIISANIESPPTAIMRLWAEVRDRITVIDLAMQDGNDGAIRDNIKRLDSLLAGKSANYLELTSFFPALDVSYSGFRKLDEIVRLEFLERAVFEFIHKRHRVYMSHGYTPTTIQVRRDFEKHKTSGNAAKRKVEALLEERGYTHATDLNSFLAGRSYIHADGALYDRCESWLRNAGLRFGWRASHQNKLPDLVVNSPTRILMIECKHMKEVGGGQDKQLAELIALISDAEDACVREAARQVSYVAFLDGVLFNELKEPRARKLRQQRQDILEALERCPENYFVNSWGFNRLIAITE